MSTKPSGNSARESRVMMVLLRARLLVGDVGWWVLVLLGLFIHLATVWIAFSANEGLRAWLVAALSAVVPAVPEVYWAFNIASREGTLMHPYVLAIIGYPVACTLFMFGGWLFFPDRDPDQVDAAGGAER